MNNPKLKAMKLAGHIQVIDVPYVMALSLTSNN